MLVPRHQRLVLRSVLACALALAAVAAFPSLCAARQHTGLPSTDRPIGWAARCHTNSLAGQRRCIGRYALLAAARRPHVRPHDAGPQWLGYATDVNPGSGIQFPSSTVGYRIDGTYASPWMDDNVSSGPAGTTLTWPQPTMSKTTDGGVTWTTVHSDQNGLWGMDFITPDEGWVVGVTSLSGTTDGGGTWHTLGEPEGSPLVTVQFTSPTQGFGLTTAGQLVRTSNGGSTWQAGALAGHQTAICFSPDGVGYSADQAGNLSSTTNGGGTWTQAQPSTIPAVYPQVWNELACDQDSVWHGDRIVSPLLHEEAYTLQYKGSGSSIWSTLASNTAGGPSLTPAAAPSNGLESLEGVASSKGHMILAGLPMRGFAPGAATATLTSPASTSASSTSPVYAPMPASQSLNPLTTDPGAFVRILGVSAEGGQSWMYVQDAAIRGVSPTFETVVLHSSDGGQSWSTVNNSGTQTQPQYGS